MGWREERRATWLARQRRQRAIESCTHQRRRVVNVVGTRVFYDCLDCPNLWHVDKEAPCAGF